MLLPIDFIRIREFSCKDNLIPVPTLLHPLANPCLRLLILVAIGCLRLVDSGNWVVCIDEIASLIVVVIKKFKGIILIYTPHKAFPCGTQTHGPEGQRGNTDTGVWGKNSVSVQWRDWVRRCCECYDENKNVV